VKSSGPSQKQAAQTLPTQEGGLALMSDQMTCRNRAAERNGRSDVWIGERKRWTGRTNTAEELKTITTLGA